MILAFDLYSGEPRFFLFPAGKINERLKEIESFIETANSLRADVFQSEGDVGGEGVGGNGKESKAINGEVPGAEQ